MSDLIAEVGGVGLYFAIVCAFALIGESVHYARKSIERRKNHGPETDHRR